MALHTLTDDGNMQWWCPGCQQENTVHISHEQVEHPKINGEVSDPHVVALPPCTCSARVFLNVHFNDEELSNPVDTPEWAKRREIVLRHKELAKQMIDVGKTPVAIHEETHVSNQETA